MSGTLLFFTYQENSPPVLPSTASIQEVRVLTVRAHCGSHLEGLVLFGVYFPGL